MEEIKRVSTKMIDGSKKICGYVESLQAEIAKLREALQKAIDWKRACPEDELDELERLFGFNYPIEELEQALLPETPNTETTFKGTGNEEYERLKKLEKICKAIVVYNKNRKLDAEQFLVRRDMFLIIKNCVE